MEGDGDGIALCILIYCESVCQVAIYIIIVHSIVENGQRIHDWVKETLTGKKLFAHNWISTKESRYIDN